MDAQFRSPSQVLTCTDPLLLPALCKVPSGFQWMEIWQWTSLTFVNFPASRSLKPGLAAGQFDRHRHAKLASDLPTHFQNLKRFRSSNQLYFQGENARNGNCYLNLAVVHFLRSRISQRVAPWSSVLTLTKYSCSYPTVIWSVLYGIGLLHTPWLA